MDSVSEHLQKIPVSADTDEQSQLVKLFGNSCPNSTFVFICQIIVVFTVICASIYNLSTNSEDKTLWTSLLSSCIGYILPQPVIKKVKNVPLSPK